MTDVFEGDAIGLGRGAAADGSGEKCVAGDRYGRVESFDVEAECGDRVAREIAGGDGDFADADGIAGFHRGGFPDALGVDGDAVLEEMADAAGVVAVAVGDEDPVGQSAKAVVELRAQVLGLIAAVEEDLLVFHFEHPRIHMPSAEGECEAVDFGWNRCLGSIRGDRGVGIRIEVECGGDFAGKGFVELTFLKLVECGDACFGSACEFLRCQRVANHRFAQDVGEVVFRHFHAPRFR